MTEVDDRDTRFVWVADLKQMSHNIKYSEVSGRNGVHIHLGTEGYNEEWIRMNKQYTMEIEP